MNYRKIVSDIEDILEDGSNYDQLDDIRSIIKQANEPEEETEDDIEAMKRIQVMLFKRAGKSVPDELKDVEPAGRKKTPKEEKPKATKPTSVTKTKAELTPEEIRQYSSGIPGNRDLESVTFNPAPANGFASVDIKWTPEPVTPEMQARWDKEEEKDKEIRAKDPRVDTSKLHDFIDIKCVHHYYEGEAHTASFDIHMWDVNLTMDANKNILWVDGADLKTYEDVVAHSIANKKAGHDIDILGTCDACEDECALEFIHADGTTTNDWTGTDSSFDGDYETKMFQMKYPEIQF